MTTYALGFVVACFVGMFVAGILTDWADRRHNRRIETARARETKLTLAHIEHVRQVVAAETAKARRREAETRMRDGGAA